MWSVKLLRVVRTSLGEARDVRMLSSCVTGGRVAEAAANVACALSSIQVERDELFDVLSCLIG